MEIKQLNQQEVAQVEDWLQQYDEQHVERAQSGRISLGYFGGESLIAGIDGQMTSFHIFYISTLFVDKAYRRKGLGRALLNEIEKKAAALGANMIRLDTFDWQGVDFCRAIGYKSAESYQNEKDNFGEYFFIRW